jgi:hypothetical protein
VDLVIQPLLAPEGRGRVWVGVRDPAGAPILAWTLDGAPAPQPPHAIRPLGPVLGDHGLGGGRVLAGIYEIDVAPGGRRRVGVQIGDRQQACWASALPGGLPRRGENGLDGRWFNVLVASCYDRSEAVKHAAAKVLKRIRPDRMPDIGLFLGDQVYLDLPTLRNFPADEVGLARILRENYADTWFEGSPATGAGESLLFGLAPRACIPDDHEYWNNAPHGSPFIQNSWTQRGRDDWKDVAKELFSSFQLTGSGGIGTPIRFDVPPLSFLLLDSRTHRESDRSTSLDANSLAALDRWCQHLLDERRFGVFATGQSVVGDRSGWLSRLTAPLAKRVGDFGLHDYGDFARIAGNLARVARPERPLVCLTGDVHFGRVVWGHRRLIDSRPCFYEMISSPLALVRTVGADEVARGWGALKGWLGPKDPWPRHADPKEPPPAVRLEDPAQSILLERWRGQRGDHLAVLSFRKEGAEADPRVALEIRYYPLDGDDTAAEPPVVRLQLGGWPEYDAGWEGVRQ